MKAVINSTSKKLKAFGPGDISDMIDTGEESIDIERRHLSDITDPTLDTDFYWNGNGFQTNPI